MIKVLIAATSTLGVIVSIIFISWAIVTFIDYMERKHISAWENFKERLQYIVLPILSIIFPIVIIFLGIYFML